MRVEGYPAEGDIFLLANHVSWIDILALGGATGAAFVSQDGVARWPVVGWPVSYTHLTLPTKA